MQNIVVMESGEVFLQCKVYLVYQSFVVIPIVFSGNAKTYSDQGNWYQIALVYTIVSYQSIHSSWFIAHNAHSAIG